MFLLSGRKPSFSIAIQPTKGGVSIAKQRAAAESCCCPQGKIDEYQVGEKLLQNVAKTPSLDRKEPSTSENPPHVPSLRTEKGRGSP